MKAEKRRTTRITTNSLVNREFEFSFDYKNSNTLTKNNAEKIEKSALFENTRLIAKDLAKTLIFAIVIFSLEMVIYFAWLK